MKSNQQTTQNFLLSLALVLSTFLQLFSQTAVTYQSLHTQTTFDNKTVDTTKTTGSINGTSSTMNGSAYYSIPIPLPPSTNNIKPELTLNYSSSGGTSQLGFGWSLSGLSMISRIGKNIYYDGTNSDISFTSNDRFSLDGNYLVLKSGTYGANNSTYSAESENFSTITFTISTIPGQFGNSAFTLVTKEGIVMQYGFTQDSRFPGNLFGHNLFWRLNKVTYPDGNFI